MTLKDVGNFTGLAEGDLIRLGESVLRDIPDAVIYADREGVIRFWNAGAERIFGFSQDGALGQSLDIIIPERLRQRHWDGYRHMMETARSRHAPDELLSVPAQTKSGQTLSIQFTVAPVRNQGGAPAGIVAVLRDVTATFQELKRLRADMRPSRS
jgi:PAS domain S-box-containing protein